MGTREVIPTLAGARRERHTVRGSRDITWVTDKKDIKHSVADKKEMVKTKLTLSNSARSNLSQPSSHLSCTGYFKSITLTQVTSNHGHHWMILDWTDDPSFPTLLKVSSSGSKYGPTLEEMAPSPLWLPNLTHQMWTHCHPVFPPLYIKKNDIFIIVNKINLTCLKKI